MAKFEFSLDGVLHFRRTAVEREEARLQELLRERDYWAWQDRQLEESCQQSRRATPALARDGQITLQTQDLYLQRAAKQQRQILMRQRDCLQRVMAQQARLAEAHRQLKLIEKLREKAYSEWQREQNRQLEELAADAYLAKWNRERRTGLPSGSEPSALSEPPTC